MNYFMLDFRGLLRNFKNIDALKLPYKQNKDSIDSQELNIILFEQFFNEFYTDRMRKIIKYNTITIELNSLRNIIEFKYHIVSRGNIGLFREDVYGDYYRLTDNIENSKNIFNLIKEDINNLDLEFSNLELIIDISENRNIVFELISHCNSKEIIEPINNNIGYDNGNSARMYKVNNMRLYNFMNIVNNRIQEINEKEYKNELIKRGFK
ncbi:hypothetical protein CPT_Machias_037 [Staphylococcus phage Machias]|nr:hypothetical protein CPT_Machias_037 [Staphylococcus phage Machias]